MTYYAKSMLDNGRQPTVAEHLRAVMSLAEAFGTDVGMRNEARLAADFHDFGKYSEAFQAVLRGERTGVDHAIAGAAALRASVGEGERYAPVIEAVNGHHDGLVSADALRERLYACLTGQGPAPGNAGKAPALVGKAAYQCAMRTYCEEMGKPDFGIGVPEKPEDAVGRMLRTRMLFSCLVDADYTASAMDEQPDFLSRSEREGLDAQALLERLYAHMAALRGESKANEGVNRLRNALFEQCGDAGDGPRGLYTLTAPTGTGKTLAMLHFALRHCRRWGMKRVIVVLPFLTLTEQSAQVYRDIVADVLEDHSQAKLGDEQRMFSARWSVPFIVTTSVRFFESLFAARPTDCRKLHHIAGSVVLFDEVQSLPTDLLDATLRASRALCDQFGCTMVFSSATQPAFDALPGLDWRPVEIARDSRALYEGLRRTQVEWRLDEPTPFEEIAGEMARETSACAIVNRRNHARLLFDMLRERCPEGTAFFLTTDLCPAHRRKSIDTIRARLKDGLPCRVVATQCVEAGVDLDFGVMLRALAPLDSIIQAAGRCNRNGRQPEGGRVVVFIPDAEGRLYPSDWYQNAANIVRLMHAEGGVDIHSPDDIRRYYELLLPSARERTALTRALREGDYAKTAQAYQLIASGGEQVIVPFDKALYQELYEQYRREGLSAALLAKAAPITVSTYDDAEAYAERLCYPGKGSAAERASHVLIIRPQHEDCYDSYTGLLVGKRNETIQNGSIFNDWY